MEFKTIADAIKALGEARTLTYINAHSRNMVYRKDRAKRIAIQDQEDKQLLAKAKNDPRFADLFKKKTA